MPGRNLRARGTALPSAQPQQVCEYLDREVLHSLPDHLVTFLRRTSCMEVLTADRCDALLGERTSRRMLAELEKRGAMVHSHDGGVTYRVHGALRRHLETELCDELEASEARTLYRRAAELLSEDEEHVEALRVLTRTGDWEAACAMAKQHGEAVAAAGAASWVDAVPTQVVQTDPWLQLGLARRHLHRGHPKAAGQQAAAAAASFTVPEGRRLAQATYDVAQIWLGNQEPPPNGWVAHLHRAATRDPAGVAQHWAPTRSSDDEVGRALAYALAGDVRTANRMLRHCLDVLEDEQTFLAARLALIVLADAPGSSGALLVDEITRDYPWFGRIVDVLTSVQEAIASGATLDHCLLLEAIDDRDRHGDPWGALAIAAIRAVAQLRTGSPDGRAMEDLVDRCRGLGCATLEAWARAGLALAAAITAAPEAALEAQTAEAFARTAGVPGAAAVAYATLAASDPDRLGELLALAESLADEVGLTFRPWTWLPLTNPDTDRSRQCPIRCPSHRRTRTAIGVGALFPALRTADSRRGAASGTGAPPGTRGPPAAGPARRQIGAPRAARRRTLA